MTTEICFIVHCWEISKNARSSPNFYIYIKANFAERSLHLTCTKTNKWRVKEIVFLSSYCFDCMCDFWLYSAVLGCTVLVIKDSIGYLKDCTNTKSVFSDLLQTCKNCASIIFIQHLKKSLWLPVFNQKNAKKNIMM